MGAAALVIGALLPIFMVQKKSLFGLQRFDDREQCISLNTLVQVLGGTGVF